MSINKFMKTLIIGKVANGIFIYKINETAKKYNISKCEADVLLFFSNNEKCCNAKDVVKLRHISKAYVSKATSLLLSKGFITIVTDTKDKRYQEIIINDCAKEIVESLKSTQHKFYKDLMKNIDDDDKKIFLKVLDQIKNNILDMEDENVKDI